MALASSKLRWLRVFAAFISDLDFFLAAHDLSHTGCCLLFTGGWHGSNGDGTGTPTTSTSEVSFAVDEKKANGNFELDCNQVDLYVTNLPSF